MQSQRQSRQPRYIVSQTLNTWVVRDTEAMKRKKRSIVAEATTKEDAEATCALYNLAGPATKARVG